MQQIDLFSGSTAPRPSPAPSPNPRYMQVSEVFARLTDLFSQNDWATRARVFGEVAELKRSGNGVYFSLRDSQSRLSCVAFGYAATKCQRQLKEGERFIISGSLQTYSRSGVLNLRVTNVECAGQGILREQLERLRLKLQAEHLFDDERKLPLPAYPKVVGLVTSATGMARGDIEKIFRERNPQVQLWLSPALVQGVNAPASLISAIKTLERLPEVDVIILGRGGGSAEDLMVFNDEQLVRTVAACTKPIVTAIGHDGDHSLCDLAASQEASTPTNAACVAVPHACADLRAEVSQLFARAANVIDRQRQLMRQQVQQLSRQCHLLSPQAKVAANRQTLELQRQRLLQRGAMLTVKGHHDLRLVQCSAAWQNLDRRLVSLREEVQRCQDRMQYALTERSENLHATLSSLGQTLQALNPLRPLSKGYALVRDACGDITSSVASVSPGQSLVIQLEDGSLDVEVKSVTPTVSPTK